MNFSKHSKKLSRWFSGNLLHVSWRYYPRIFSMKAFWGFSRELYFSISVDWSFFFNFRSLAFLIEFSFKIFQYDLLFFWQRFRKFWRVLYTIIHNTLRKIDNSKAYPKYIALILSVIYPTISLGIVLIFTFKMFKTEILSKIHDE